MRLSTFVDLDGHYFDAVHFPNVVDKYPIRGRGVYACQGKITEEFGHCSMTVTWSKKASLKPDPRSPEEYSYENIDLFKKLARKQIKS
jgi:DNA polymerase-3 subunit alpha